MNYLFLDNGFEEIEAITVVDLLRRAEISLTTVSLTGKDLVLVLGCRDAHPAGRSDAAG